MEGRGRDRKKAKDKEENKGEGIRKKRGIRERKMKYKKRGIVRDLKMANQLPHTYASKMADHNVDNFPHVLNTY